MKLRKLVEPLQSLLVGVMLAGMAVLPAFAATSSVAGGAANGLKVSPVTTNIVIDKGESRTVTVYVQNVTKDTSAFQAVINDFVASNNETGQPALLLNPNQYAPSHSLKRYVAPISDFTLGPGEQKSVSVNITIPKDAVAGGYFGAVRFAPASLEGGNNVTLSASVGSLILVKVPGNFKEDLRLVSLDVRQGDDGAPQVVFMGGSTLTAAARFENKGDVQEQPFGKILLRQGGTQLASYEINNTTPRGNVLPDSIRKFTVKLDKVGLFGQYTVYGNFGFGSNGELLSGQTTFYVIPLLGIILVLLGIALVLFLIFGLPRLVRGYNARVLRRAGRR